MQKKFYICRHCGNLVEVINNAGVPMMCCGQKMEELVPNTSDGAGEKHVPFVTAEDGAIHVQIGEVVHPMLDEHYIQWIYVETENGCQRVTLKPGDAPEATFCVGDEKPVAVYEYCNIHGLWKIDLK